MLDARYHLFYTIMIFLMLGFGILIGASYYGPVQVRQQQAVVRRLAEETNAVVQQRNEIRARLSDDESALAALRPDLVRGKLAGKRVILVQTGDYADATQSATESLEEAGATVAGAVVLSGRWGALTPKQRQTLSSIADPSDPAAQDKALLAALASALAHGTGALPGALPGATSANAATLAAVQSAGLLTVSGDFSLPCTLFVVVGGGSSDATGPSVDAGLLAGFQSVSGVTIAGCEPFAAAASSVPAFQSAGIATVDCIDLPLGQIALPFALRGEAGDYGLKPTAKQRLPDSLGGTSAP